MSFLDELDDELSGDEFEEKPVDFEEFITSKQFLGLKGLSPIQMSLARAMSQIYKLETLQNLYGYEPNEVARAERRFRETCKEIIMQLGKGSGKDFTSTVAVCYVVYLLLCLKDPAEYYDKSSGDSIDIINIAINSDQAQRVFFENFINKIKKCPWFDGKYEDKTGAVKFIKNINVYSGHSEREAFEGYNTFMVILDEIAGFAEAPDDAEDGEELAKTSKAIYKMYRGSITSRFPDFGKLVLLSFPRHKDDFIQKRYEAVIAEKEIVVMRETVKRDIDLPDGTDGNEMVIEWEHDEIVRYSRNKVFALRRTSWEVNPARRIQDYADDFFDDVGDAMGRFACMPSNATRGFFKRMDRAEESFRLINGVDGDGIFHPKFEPKKDTKYFFHVDLAQKHDKCAVALAHVDKWLDFPIPGTTKVDHLPFVIVDAIRWWTPTKTQSVDFKAVVDYIKSVRRKGFDVGMATFDRWNSHDTMQELERNGIETDLLSVAKKHYDDWLVTMYDDRLAGPNEETLLDEMRELVEKKGKVDHPRKGNKDLCDAVCGAIFNAVAYTPYAENTEIDAMVLEDFEDWKNPTSNKERDMRERGVIIAPRASVKDASVEIQTLVADLMRVL